jgi:hypothetical protein
VNVYEQCQCGSVVQINVDKTHTIPNGEVFKQVNVWRKYHRCKVTPDDVKKQLAKREEYPDNVLLWQRPYA